MKYFRRFNFRNEKFYLKFSNLKQFKLEKIE